MSDFFMTEPLTRVTEALDAAMSLRDASTFHHASRVTNLSRQLGEACGLSTNEHQLLEACARFHDIGKIGMPDHILRKPGELTSGEYRTIQQHSTIGANLFRQIKDPATDSVADIIQHHHERFDGKGYPHFLAGNEIPLLARIISIVDSYDAITSRRYYHPPYPASYALEVIDSERGRQFDPELADLFLSISRKKAPE